MARTRNLGNLTDLLAANTSTGIVSANTTPSQFDNSSQLVTSGFVQRALGNDSGVYAANNVTDTLTAANIGNFVIVGGGSASSLTMPVASVSALGGKISFLYVGSASLTVLPQSPDTVFNATTGTVPNVVLKTGDTISLEMLGSKWYLIGGSAQLGLSAAFGSSFAGSGYQKLPSGMIFQWGALTVPAASIATATFPIAFPTACRGVMISVNDAGTVSNYRYSVSSYTASGCGVANQFSGQSLVFNYLAVGN